uniref:Uncharacterized protein n=1 Tax=Oryza meridionalis TaxID=40149 RepID=A0A0E0DCN9_9ORYZ
MSPCRSHHRILPPTFLSGGGGGEEGGLGLVASRRLMAMWLYVEGGSTSCSSTISDVPPCISVVEDEVTLGVAT